MKQHIEDTLYPETVNELLLVNRIRELQREAYMRGPSPSFYDIDPNRTEISVSYPLPLTLHLAASAEVESDHLPGSLRIMARSRGPKEAQLGFGTYVTRQELDALGPREAANLMGHMHQKTLHALAKHLETNHAF